MAIDAWFGLFGPANLPREVVAKLEAASKKVMEDPEIRKKFLSLGLIPKVQGSAQFRTQVESDIRLYTDVKTRAKLVVE